MSFRKGDAQVYPLPGASFDAVVSRFGMMFFDDPVAAFANLGRALKPGGRIAFTCWRDLLVNDWLMVPAGAALQYVPMPDLGPPGAPGPFSLADPERVHRVLRDAAFTQVALEEIARPMPMGNSADDVLAFMRGTDMAQVLMTGVDPDTAEQAWAAVKQALQAHAEPDGHAAGPPGPTVPSNGPNNPIYTPGLVIAEDPQSAYSGYRRSGDAPVQVTVRGPLPAAQRAIGQRHARSPDSAFRVGQPRNWACPGITGHI